MIDCENEIFSTVANALRAEFSGPPMIFVAGESVAAPSSFPAAMGVEMDNSVYARSLDSSGVENHANVMWQWEAYSNKSVGRKTECKAIMAIIDDEMQGMGFVRTGSSPVEVPNADKTIYRMVARYRATVSKDKVVYKR